MVQEREDPGTGRLKVFVSYSRTDIDFADQLVLALEDKGFQPFLDRHDIDAAENWKERLSALIFSSDTIVFVLTEKSAASPICGWEVEEAARLGKRMIPVAPHALNDVKAPPALAELNYVHFFKHPDIPGSGFYDGVQKLERALKTDLAWLRQQTRLGEDVAEWEARGRSDDMLLRGQALQEAQAWAARPPKSATISDATREYINLSEEAAQGRAAQARAQLAEREKALKEREMALSERRAAERRLRARSLLALAIGVVLLAIAIPGNYFAARRSLDANARRAAQFGVAAQQLADNGDYIRAMLMALQGDPDLRDGLLERFFLPEGNVPVRNALVRGYTHNMIDKTVNAPGMIVLLAAGKNGAMFVDGTRDGDARVWRFGDKQPLWSFDKEAAAKFDAIALWPDGGGASIASLDGTITLRNAAAGKPEATFKTPAGDPIRQMVTTSEGAFTLLARQGGAFELWRASDGVLVHAGDLGSGRVGSLAISEDGRVVMFSLPGQAIVFGAIGAGERPEVIPLEHLISAFMSPDGRYVLGTEGTSSTLWEAGKKEPVHRFEYRQERSILSAAFSNDGQSLVLGLMNGTVERWLIGNGAPEMAAKGHDAVVSAIGVYPGNGQEFLTASVDGTVKRWKTARPSVQSFSTKAPMDSSALSPGGDQVLLGTAAGVELWRVGEAKPVQTFAQEPGGVYVRTVAFHPDGKRAFTFTKNRILQLWTIGRNAPDITYTRAEVGEDIASVAFSPDGQYVVAGSWDGLLTVWKSDIAVAIKTIKLTITGPTALAISPDNKKILVGSSGPAELVSIDGSTVTRKFESKDAGAFGSPTVAFSPDGQRAFVGRSDGNVSMWTIEGDAVGPSKVYLGDPRETALVKSISISRDGRLMLAGMSDGARLFDTETRALLQSFDFPIEMSSLSGDGKRVLLGLPGPYAILAATDPIVLASASEQVRLACAKLAALGVAAFSQGDLMRFPILESERLTSCSE